MSTVTKDKQKILSRVKELREKAISYQMIDLAKQGLYDNAVLDGYDIEKDVFVFKHKNGELELKAFAFVQRAETPVLDTKAKANFTEGVLKGLDPGLDASVAVTAVLIEHIGDAFSFGESAEKSMSVFSNSKGIWKVIKGTDLVITKIKPVATPAPKPRKKQVQS